MVILSLADFHLSNDDEHISRDFENSLAYFEKFFRTKIMPVSQWRPDFICVCGDIANKAKKDEFEQAKKVINSIARLVELPTDHVMLVPGNHDLCRPQAQTAKLKIQKSWFHRIAEWVKGSSPCQNTSGYTNTLKEISKWLEDGAKVSESLRQTLLGMFGDYASFRNSLFSENIDGISYIDLMSAVGVPELKGLCGIRKFDNGKIAFAELNSTWCDLGGTNRNVRFGHNIVNKAYQELDALKRAGYFIVGLFHHSMRFLDIEEYQARSMFDVYDNIVKVCDMCLSGHEHGARAKEPDFLGNQCQYFLNAGFMSPDPHNNLLESGAMLLQIDRYKETIKVRKFLRESDNSWYEHPRMSTCSYAINTHYGSASEGSSEDDNEIKIVDPTEYRVRAAEIIRVFGSKYSLGKSISRDTCELVYHSRDAEDSKVVAYVAFISSANYQKAELVFPDSKLRLKLFVFIVDRKHSAGSDETTVKLKGGYRTKHLSGNLVLLS